MVSLFHIIIQIGGIIENMGIDNVELANKFKSYFDNNEKI